MSEQQESSVRGTGLQTKFEGVKGENGQKNSIKVVGGQIIFPFLTAELSKDPNSFAQRKIIAWHQMLLDRQRPRRWYKASKKGTKVNFDFMYEESEAEAAVAEFKEYIEQVEKERQARYNETNK